MGVFAALHMWLASLGALQELPGSTESTDMCDSGQLSVASGVLTQVLTLV